MELFLIIESESYLILELTKGNPRVYNYFIFIETYIRHMELPYQPYLNQCTSTLEYLTALVCSLSFVPKFLGSITGSHLEDS